MHTLLTACLSLGPAVRHRHVLGRALATDRTLSNQSDSQIGKEGCWEGKQAATWQLLLITSAPHTTAPPPKVQSQPLLSDRSCQLAPRPLLWTWLAGMSTGTMFPMPQSMFGAQDLFSEDLPGSSAIAHLA